MKPLSGPVSSMTMSVEKWIDIQANPRQRDTEKHAAKAKHLLTPIPAHAFVFAAQLPSGKLVKLDGHTRALLWERGQVPAPVELQVGVIPVKNMDEAEETYSTFDSNLALETMKDKVGGAFNRFNFVPESGLLQSGSITYAMRVAWAVLHNIPFGSQRGRAKQRADIYEMVNQFSPELLAFDTLGLRTGQASAGILAAFILSYRRYGSKSMRFWNAVFGNGGEKSGGKFDGVQAVSEIILGRKKSHGGTAAVDICARALMAYERWNKDELMTRLPPPLDLRDYLVGHEKAAERLIKKDDAKKKAA